MENSYNFIILRFLSYVQNKFWPLYPICNEIMDNYKKKADHGLGGAWSSNVCNKDSVRSKLKTIIIDENLKDRKICTQAMLYLVDVQSMLNNTLLEASCVYLYFWLSHNIKEVKNIKDITENYDNLLKLYKSFSWDMPIHNCYKYKIDFTQEDLGIIKDIHYTHNYAKKRDNNSDNYNQEFYNKVVSFKKYFDKQMQTEETVTCNTEVKTITKTTVSCKNNISFPIIITLFITSLISILLFTLYKYTSFSSYLKRILSYKRNKWNLIDEEINRFQETEISSSIKRDDEYYMLSNYQGY
ncbi:variable surface protein [Plasmodium gonderi]|uniref:Variable surface protein n=1 Tax=Plasmodium gonderi TaxID=77519 RepID=A0A1Y1JW81_PLAGO|nr:variable surface protein [Plasmodium gonderi]GAW84603.1 variable surface protein [Plasmodium gonderi]